MTDENPLEDTPEDVTPAEEPSPMEPPVEPPLRIVAIQVYHDNRGRQVTERTLVHAEDDADRALLELRQFEGVAIIQFKDDPTAQKHQIQFELKADTILGAFEVYEKAAHAAATAESAKYQDAKQAALAAQQKVQIAPASALEGLPGPEGLDLTGR